MFLKIAGLLYIFCTVIVYIVIIIYDTGRFIRFLKDKNLRKDTIKDLLCINNFNSYYAISGSNTFFKRGI